jgi:asparagine synthase (glutamine-hydrolysing)
MCGIVGIWRKTGSHPTREDIQVLADQLRHRGPDASGIFTCGSLALGHRRLKIIDLSDAANQPYTNGRHTLVFNGEIFNYCQLRRELEPHCAFTTSSDTEVLFQALIRWGKDALSRLDGQFAFAFHDMAANTLLLARDHVGICPLYTYEDDAVFAFSSEISPLLSVTGPRALNPQGLADYFTYRYNIQNGHTLFEGITRETPATWTLLEMNSGRRQRERYWSLRFGDEIEPGDVQEGLHTVLDEAMETQSLADVPVGMFLSGGIDSRTVLHGYAKHASPVEAFTLRFGAGDPELDMVAELGKRYHLNRHTLEFDQTVANELPQAVRILEEPFGDVIICANAWLASQAARSVRVVLSGEGGDEGFFGYSHQRSFLKLLTLRRMGLPAPVIALPFALAPPSLLGRLADYPGGFGRSEARHMQRMAGALATPGEAYLKMVSLFEPAGVAKLFTRRSMAAQADGSAIRDIFAAGRHPLHASMQAEVEQLTLIVNLLKQDRFTMAHGLEARVPLVARKVLEFATRIPVAMLAGNPAKALLQKYSGGATLPKRPFSVLASPSYRAMLAGLFDRIASDEAVRGCGVLDFVELARLRSRLTTGGLLEAKRAMTVLVFMTWLKVFTNNIKW